MNLSNFSGIIEYKPEELYIKAKAGTPLKTIINELDKNDQQLAFEPIDFGYLFSDLGQTLNLEEAIGFGDNHDVAAVPRFSC